MRPHIFLSVPLIVSLFHLTFHADVLPEGDLLNLKPILEELTDARTSNTGHRNEPIHLHGQYHLFEYVVRSVNISIVGAQSTSIVWSKTEDSQDISNTELTSMLIVTNSTVALSSLRLICHGDHSSVATIIQSSLSVSNCEINPAPSTSPFLSTCTLGDTSMLTVFNTQVNWKQHATSLPLVGTIPHNHKSLMSESSENSIFLSEPDQTTCVLSIVGSGLSFSNTALPLATGPLFDFGLNENNTQQSPLAASVSLTTSVMTNVTSRRRFIRDTLGFPLASQRLISLSISECTNHLYGCGCLDMNLGSALCCQNSSFSKCEASAEPTEGPPTVYLQHRTTHFDHARFTAFTQFDSCTFRDMRADRGGAIDSNEIKVSLSVTKCSFVRCTAIRLGGSIFFYPFFSTSAITVSQSSFVSGSADQGGAMQISRCQLASITDCVFLISTQNVRSWIVLHAMPRSSHSFELSFQKCHHQTVNDGTINIEKTEKNTGPSAKLHSTLSLNSTQATSDASSFTDCDTDKNPVRVYTPRNPCHSKLVSCVASADNRTAKSALTVDKPISKTVLMLVDNTNGMISFDFSSDSTSSESELFGEWELLQYESNYSLPKQQAKTELAEEQETEEYLAKGDVVDIGLSETQNIVAVNQLKGETTNNLSTFGAPRHETRIQNPKPIETEKIQKALTEQLLRVMQKMPTAQVLQNLNPHWVLFGNDTEVHFKVVDDQTRNQSLGEKMNNPNGGILSDGIHRKKARRTTNLNRNREATKKLDWFSARPAVVGNRDWAAPQLQPLQLYALLSDAAISAANPRLAQLAPLFPASSNTIASSRGTFYLCDRFYCGCVLAALQRSASYWTSGSPILHCLHTALTSHLTLHIVITR
ncbi:hypothetical protein BLNAU_1463 [Blattamonas nauphoetae]|uniref:Uncharacterized protein n=1 Tax=Blattamonas nauphoetae TaxID=2049346 RepID=A0ABQ9YI38_9EUKA|nr:hypothetical protein BLNAU_1463 [Blattamonas nauphoetae]